MKKFTLMAGMVLLASLMMGCPSSKPSAKVPAWDKAIHASCWDGNNAQKRMMNILSPAFSEGKVDDYINWMLSRGCDTAHVILANKADGEGGGYTIYGSTWDWTIDQAYCDIMKSRISKLRKKNMAVVVWLFTDDSSAYASAAKANFPKYLNDLKAQGLLDQASTVVLGLEMDEYLNANDANRLAQATRAVYPGKIGTHHTSGKTSFAAFGDIVFYQVKPGTSAPTIKSLAASVKASTGKPVNFFEMERNPNRPKCEAAMSGGAFAVGNW